jgi:hypothetical protein
VVVRAERGAVPGLVGAARRAITQVVALEVPARGAAGHRAAEAVAREVRVVVELRARLDPGGDGVGEEPLERARAGQHRGEPGKQGLVATNPFG